MQTITAPRHHHPLPPPPSPVSPRPDLEDGSSDDAVKDTAEGRALGIVCKGRKAFFRFRFRFNWRLKMCTEPAKITHPFHSFSLLRSQANQSFGDPVAHYILRRGCITWVEGFEVRSTPPKNR